MINNYTLIESNILNSKFKWYGDIYKFFDVVKQTGYPFFQWNCRVYKVTGESSFEDTGKNIGEVEEQ